MLSSERRPSTIPPAAETDNDDFDELLSTVGFGRWQAVSVTMVLTIAGLMPVQLVGMTLIAPPIPYRCHNASITINDLSTHTTDDRLLETLQADEDNGTFFNEKCLTSPQRLDPNLEWVPPTNSAIPTNLESCPYIEYDTSTFSSSVVSDFHLVCERFPQQSLYQITYTIGCIFGSIIGGHAGDRWGRRKAVQVGAILYLGATLMMAYVPVFEVVLTMRVVAGLAVTTQLVTGWNLVVEEAPPNKRTLVGMLMGLPFSIFVVIFAGVGYYIRTWQELMLVCSTPVLLLLPLSFIVDESPRWLIQECRGKEATAILRKAARLNKIETTVDISAVVEKIIQKNRTKQPKISEEAVSFSQRCTCGLQEGAKYFTMYAMRIIIIVIPIIWFFQSFVYLGLAINANNFAGDNPFLYVGLTGVMDAGAIIISTPATPFLGRRIMVGGELFVGGVLLLLELAIPEDYAWSKWVLVMIGFLLVAGAFQVNFVYAPELFPTDIRATGFAFANLAGGLGFLCAPLITTLLAKLSPWAPGVVFGTSGICISLLVPLLPETNHKPLPDTLQDVEDRWRTGKIKSKTKGKGIDNLAYKSDQQDV